MPSLCTSLQPLMCGLCSGAIRAGCGVRSMRPLPCMMPKMLVSYHGQSIGINEMTCMGMQVAECMEIAQNVFREDPYVENELVVQHITNFFWQSLPVRS